jgi:hypothetical protein
MIQLRRFYAFLLVAASVGLLRGQTITTTHLSVSTTGTVSGQPVTFKAAVNPAPPIATVTFLEGANILNSQTVPGGTVSFTTSALPVGSHTVVAVFKNSPPFTGSISNPVTVTIKQVNTFTLSASPGSSTYRQPITLTGATNCWNPGTSMFFDEGSNVLNSVPYAGSESAAFRSRHRQEATCFRPLLAAWKTILLVTRSA